MHRPCPALAVARRTAACFALDTELVICRGGANNDTLPGMRRSPLAMLVLFAGACGGGSDAPTVKLPPGCDQMLAQCLAIQQICADGPTCQACPDGQYADADGVCKPIVGTRDDARLCRLHHRVGRRRSSASARAGRSTTPTSCGSTPSSSTRTRRRTTPTGLFVPDDQLRRPRRRLDVRGPQLRRAERGARRRRALRAVDAGHARGAEVPQRRGRPHSAVLAHHQRRAHPQRHRRSRSPATRAFASTRCRVADVKIKLAPFHLGFDGLDIPAHGAARASPAACELDSSFQSAFNTRYRRQALLHPSALPRAR